MGETSESLLVVLLEIVVVAPVVIVDELVALVHLWHQKAGFLPPPLAILVIAHESVGSADTQQQSYLHRIFHTSSISLFKCLQVGIDATVHLS